MLSKFERYPLTFGPTPIEHLPRLTAHLGGDVLIYAKREDCNSGLAYGGNKLRKLEYIVPDAIASGADTLVSIGGVQSNHTRMVAAVAAKIGMKCRLIQEAWVPHEDAVYDRVGNIMLSRIMGAETQLVDDGFDIGIRESWTKALEDVKAKGGKPYAIPAGASVHKFGGLGYVGFAEEVRAQEAEMGVHFDYIVVCTVTGSTHAGMVVGFAADGRARNVIGIDASCTPAQTKAQVLEIARNTAELIGAPADHRRRHRAERGLRLPGLRRALEGDRRGDPPLGPPGRHDHRPRLRGEVHAGHDRPRAEGLLPQGLEGALRPSRRRPGAQRLQLHLPQRLRCRTGRRRCRARTGPGSATGSRGPPHGALAFRFSRFRGFSATGPPRACERGAPRLGVERRSTIPVANSASGGLPVGPSTGTGSPAPTLRRRLSSASLGLDVAFRASRKVMPAGREATLSFDGDRRA